MSPKTKENMSWIAGVLIPIIVSFIALGIQWGEVRSKLSYFETRLDDVMKSNADVREDVAEIKGMLKK